MDDLVPVERKLTNERKTTVCMMRKSEAQLRANMTNAMQDAWVLIETAFQAEAGHMGYGCHDLNHVKGHTNLNREERIQKYMQDYREWCKQVDSRCRGVVLDICVFGFTAKDVAFQRAIDPKTVTARLHKGLNDYCIMMGWGDQIGERT